MQETVLITGANRGIGLELARQYAAAGWRVFACCRQPDQARALAAVARGNDRLTLHRLDVTSGETITGLRQELGETPIDLLLNNAGTFGSERQGYGEANDEAGWLQTFRTNALGPLRLTEAFADRVAASRRRLVAVMGTQMGSIGDNRSGGYYVYRSTKAAAHMIARSLAADLKPRGIAVVVLHPGWVRTDMGGPNATLSPEESAEGLRRVLAGMSLEKSGRFFNYAGEELPW